MKRLDRSSSAAVLIHFVVQDFFSSYDLGEKIGQGAYWKMFEAKAVGSPDDLTTYAIKRVRRLGIREKNKKALLEEASSNGVKLHVSTLTMGCLYACGPVSFLRSCGGKKQCQESSDGCET